MRKTDRKKENTIIILTAIVISFMMVGFTMMIIFIQNHYDAPASQIPVSVTEEESAVSQPLVETESMEEYVKPEENIEVSIEEIIYTSDKIDLAMDDTAIHEVSFEDSYTDTVALLPSVFYEHQPVEREQVSKENFMQSFEGLEKTGIIVQTALEGEEESVFVPSEITLYNVDFEESSSYEIAAEITGDSSFIKSLGWSTPDSSKLSLSKTSGRATCVSRTADFTGTLLLNLIVTYDAGEGMTATEHLDIYVHVVDMTDANTRLFDMEGNELYVDEKATRPAYLEDYAKQDMFYGSMLVTGWHKIDGNTYYFNESGWAVRGEQIIGGLKYLFDEEGILIAGEKSKGIDVSLYQKEIEWEQVALSDIDFAIIRCGFRGAVTGRLVEDEYFKKNLEGAKAAGLRVGVYFFTQAVDEEEAVEEAKMVLKLCRDYSLDLPIFVDSENAQNGRANGLDKDTRTRVLKAFCETICAGGFQAGVYASTSWYNHKVNAVELEDYCIWVAQYNTACTYEGKADYWQYTSRGHISGIEGNVDLDMIMSSR